MDCLHIKPLPFVYELPEEEGGGLELFDVVGATFDGKKDVCSEWILGQKIALEFLDALAAQIAHSGMNTTSSSFMIERFLTDLSNSPAGAIRLKLGAFRLFSDLILRGARDKGFMADLRNENAEAIRESKKYCRPQLIHPKRARKSKPAKARVVLKEAA